MKNSRWHSGPGWWGCAIVLAMLLFAPSLALTAAGADVTGSPARTLRVVMDDNYPPYIFKDSKGRLKGILVDQWHLWEQKAGIRAELSAMDWAEAQRRMQAGEFDVIDTMFRSEKRERIYDFTKPYARLDVPLYFRSNISGISDINDLKGFAVGVKAGGNVIDVLKSKGINDLIEFNNYEAIVSAARDHKINVFTVEKPPAHYFLYKFGIQDQFRETKPLYTGEFHRAVAKGNQALLETVENGFAKISKAEYEEIEKRWYGAPILSKGQMRTIWIGSAVFVAILIVLFLWLWMLQRMVAQRTAALQKEIRSRMENEALLRENEEHYRSIIELAADTILLGDPSGAIIGVNKSGTLLTGYRAEELLGKNIALLFSEEELLRVPFRYDQLREGKTVRSERLLTRKDGTQVPIEMNTRMMPDGTYQAFIRDMSERQRMQAELIRHQKLESLGVLAGGIAHDFNNILTGILGNISFARMFLDESHRASTLLGKAEKACQRATDLAHQLLTFAKGSQPIKKAVSARHLVEESASLVLRGSNVLCVIDIPEELHDLEVDEGQISQALNNIIINAAQAMPGGGTITITAENLTVANANAMPLAPGEYVRFTVTDTGCGIPEEDQKRIFDPYFTTKVSGNGLGLASVHSIITKHGGHVGVRSRVGTGATFEITLPASSRKARETETDVPAVVAGENPGGSILVMDDEDMIRDLAVEMLGELGYTVRTCRTGEEAVALYGEATSAGAPFAAVIMDLTIPGGMGGKEAAEHILGRDPAACIIVSSGYSNDPVMAEYSNFGFSATLLKPYTLAEITQVMNKLLPGDPVARTGTCPNASSVTATP